MHVIVRLIWPLHLHSSSCVQVFELFNAGDTPVSYAIDTAPLDELKKVPF